MSLKIAAKTAGAGFAVAALAALAQLGLASGFDLLSWVDAAPGAESVLEYRENANVAWVGWFAAVSCVVGGLASGAIGSRAADRLGPATRVAAVVASALGAFLIGPLVSLSAEQSEVFTSFPTKPLVAAGIGAAVGFALALIGLSSRSVAVNVGASVVLVWLLAILAVFRDVGDPVSPVTELAVWGSWAGPDSALGLRGLSIAIPFMIGSALIGVVVAVLARRGPISSSGYRIAAASGIAGPLIVTVAHLVAGPARGDGAETMALMFVGPYAAIAGLLGSLIVCSLPKAGGQVDDAAEPNAWTGEPGTAETGLVESAPGWTVPEPVSAYDTVPEGDTKDLPAAPAVPEQPKRTTRRERRAAKQDEQKRAEWEPREGDDDPNPDVDWVQELKAVDMDAPRESEPAPEPEAAPKPARRAKKAAGRTRRKLGGDDPAPESDPDA
ncbi:DMT family transporter [Glycomyces sp. TRM65418]|uniref:DMT family transporter n=1 Tax=Glycomyces sp. TRM65418 TaxID=2867006 RepID=UPI001CE65BC7|nr:DMT family transporter [Glycomyces sp. TRM65418]MCC3765958.1 DMT family transporter [Glycomyces sp. TRM65418]QZD55539.1 DMT family transporter [Glycomyces sp. TRM65418]